jgi:antitoxin component HigA of HigAB toxin-antitoxin module
VPEVSIEDYKSDIDGLNKETDPKKFQEKLDALNKKIDENMRDKKPEEKAKLLDKVKTEIMNKKFKVKVEQKLVIVDEQKTPDVKPPALDQKESMQSFVKDIIEAIKTLMKEFGLTKEDLKGIITNKPNAPTAGLNAGNATAEQLTQAKVADAQRLAELEKRVKSLETDKNTPRGRAERIPNLDKQALEREVRDRLEQRRLDRELKRRLEIERHGQEFADRTSREGQRYGIGAQVTLDRAGIRMYSVNDRGASTLRTIEQMAPQTLPGRLVHANDGSLIVPFIYAPRNSGNINVGGIQQNFEPSLASAYEKASSATPPSAPAPRVETPPAPKPPISRRPSTSGSLE